MITTQLTFDENGYLKPHEATEVDIDTFKHYFVDAFPTSDRRKWLFENYLRYTYRFQDQVFGYFEQWINGSFISMKESPKDIDIVTFVDYNVVEARNQDLLDEFWTFSLEKEFIDAYIVKSYPDTHIQFQNYLRLRQIWTDRYAKDRNQQPKGFIKIIFSK